MEEMINIAKILKNKPKGTRLYSPIFGECAFSLVREETDDICVKKHNGVKEFFDSKGLYNALGECLLFPSREMRDWSKFAWKKGDVLISDCGFVCIFKEWASDDYTKFNGCYFDGMPNAKTDKYSKLDNNTAYGYIREIERKLGGKLNLETLEIEKQLEFKDGDIVVYGKSVAICRKIYKHTLSFYVSLNEMFGLLFADEVESSEEYRFATEEEKKQLFDALAKEGKAWDAEKKQIVDLKPKCEFKPFDRCIWKIRNCEDSIWQASFVSYVDEYGATPMGMSIDEDLVNLIILPYNDQTKLLVGTTDEWEGGEQ